MTDTELVQWVRSKYAQCRAEDVGGDRQRHMYLLGRESILEQMAVRFDISLEEPNEQA